jgi:hypothetical protein
LGIGVYDAEDVQEAEVLNHTAAGVTGSEPAPPGPDPPQPNVQTPAVDPPQPVAPATQDNLASDLANLNLEHENRQIVVITQNGFIGPGDLRTFFEGRVNVVAAWLEEDPPRFELGSVAEVEGAVGRFSGRQFGDYGVVKVEAVAANVNEDGNDVSGTSTGSFSPHHIL